MFMTKWNGKKDGDMARKVKLYFGNQGVPLHHKIIGHITASNYSIIGTPYSQSSIAAELKSKPHPSAAQA